MAIENRDLKAGTKLAARYKGQNYGCTVMEGDDKGGRRFMLDDNRLFKSPSAAGSAIMGGNACNGWRFWSLEGSEPKPKPKAKTKTLENADFRRIPGGRAWCDACAAAFKIETGTTPTVCPQGHNPEGITIDAEKEAVTA